MDQQLSLRSDFERLAPQLERALVFANGTHSLDDVWASIERDEMQFWPGQRSALVTQIDHTPKKKVLFFFLAAGDIEEVRALYDIVIEWGRGLGCSLAQFAGRAGWERSFLTREEGWGSTLRLYEKELTDG